MACDQERRELVGGVTSGVLLSDAKAELRADGKKAVGKGGGGGNRLARWAAAVTTVTTVTLSPQGAAV
eukprot:COSAG05_NODE_14512_length_395_cov_0.273649_1_plen_67_part_01